MADKLTRSGMEQIIKGGGSVMLDDGRIISSVGDLPTEAQLAKGDARSEAAAKSALLAQRAAIDAQLNALGGDGQAEARQFTATTESDDLPADYPGRKALIDDGRYVTKEAIAAASDEELLAVPFVGEKTLKEIREYK